MGVDDPGTPGAIDSSQPFPEIRSVTLTQIELAMCYWRREALRNAWDMLFADPLTGLEKRYRSLVAMRCRAIDLADLPPGEQLAILLWHASLPDEE